ncbi:unnamed protein product [Parnassius apollo]|uniref:(apollo) hypothetical protein n=1 Tax=Parnassius apollo TaxID=110799 RepID=A0A8S3XDD6_PARAO|nr:unnamed protein product [Parnassius apollo]
MSSSGVYFTSSAATVAVKACDAQPLKLARRSRQGLRGAAVKARETQPSGLVWQRKVAPTGLLISQGERKRAFHPSSIGRYQSARNFLPEVWFLRLEHDQIQGDPKEASHVSSFDLLKVNNHLEGLVSKSYNQTLLERADELTETLTHVLSKHRQILMKGIKSLTAKHPGAYEAIKQVFLIESQFKEISDDVLQITCARRAEVIEIQRKAFKPKEQHHVMKLSEIPPSETHLFDEDLLSKFLD